MRALHGIIGKAEKGGVTYRKGDREVWLLQGVSATWLCHASEPHGVECYPKRADAIERVEYLLTHA